MNIQAILANLAVNLRRPGFLKSVAGQLAIAYGTRLALDAATEADERLQAANELLETLEQRITASQAELRDRVLSGELDLYVIDRYDQLAKAKADEFERAEAEAEAEAEEPAPVPPCAWTLDCGLDYGHAGDCRPAVPPRMAGGYLRSVPADVETADQAEESQ